MEYDFSESVDFVEEVVQHLEGQKPAAPVVKSAQRLKFEAELKDIHARFGDIEEMRLQMGLSRRKMCEQLMVDPSAWTRWTQSGGAAPPHVYKTMALLRAKFEEGPQMFAGETKIPELETLNNLEVERNQSQIDSIRRILTNLQSQLDKREVLSLGWKLLLMLNFAFILYVLIR